MGYISKLEPLVSKKQAFIIFIFTNATKMALLAQKRKTDFVITSWYPMKTDKETFFVFCCNYSTDQFFMTGYVILHSILAE